MTTQKGEDLFFLILLDIGFSSTILIRRLIEIINYKKKQFCNDIRKRVI